MTSLMRRYVQCLSFMAFASGALKLRMKSEDSASLLKKTRRCCRFGGCSFDLQMDKLVISDLKRAY
ncbi:MAG TPA: hypothetical protein VKV79_07920, partial [Terriglobia bacterium]|nr:hypothetical protein [Terriglobia bacterium]